MLNVDGDVGVDVDVDVDVGILLVDRIELN